MHRRHLAYISVGSNMGDRFSNCTFGLNHLEKTPDTAIVDRSRFYETEPVDHLHQEWFINAVVKVETHMEPPVLLERLQSIEHRAGRTKSGIRFGPRTLDMDILLFDDLVMQSEALVIPHPRMQTRRFVLQPICDIDPKIVHPVSQKTMGELLAALGKTGQRATAYPC